MFEIEYFNRLEAETDMQKLKSNDTEIRNAILSYPHETWSYEMVLVYARTLNFSQDYAAHKSPCEEAYDLLLTGWEHGSGDFEWHHRRSQLRLMRAGNDCLLREYLIYCTQIHV